VILASFQALYFNQSETTNNFFWPMKKSYVYADALDDLNNCPVPVEWLRSTIDSAVMYDNLRFGFQVG
jgi:hypothetical protein